MPGELFHHMVKKADPGADVILAVAIKIDSTLNCGFFGYALNLGAASLWHGRGPFWSISLAAWRRAVM
jgi:hypothetical protein